MNKAKPVKETPFKEGCLKCITSLFLMEWTMMNIHKNLGKREMNQIMHGCSLMQTEHYESCHGKDWKDIPSNGFFEPKYVNKTQ